MWSNSATSLKSLQPAHTNARSPSSAQAALIIARVSAGEPTGILPKPKRIGGFPSAIHEATSSSASVGVSIVSAPTNGRWSPNSAHSAASPGKQTSSYAWISSDSRSAIRRGEGRDRKSTRLNSSHTEIYTLSLHDALPILVTEFRPFGCQPGKANLVVRLDFQRFTFGDPSRRGPRSEEHTSELQSHRDLHSFPTRRSSDLGHRIPPIRLPARESKPRRTPGFPAIHVRRSVAARAVLPSIGQVHDAARSQPF